MLGQCATGCATAANYPSPPFFYLVNVTQEVTCKNLHPGEEETKAEPDPIAIQ